MTAGSVSQWHGYSVSHCIIPSFGCQHRRILGVFYQSSKCVPLTGGRSVLIPFTISPLSLCLELCLEPKIVCETPEGEWKPSANTKSYVVSVGKGRFSCP